MLISNAYAQSGGGAGGGLIGFLPIILMFVVLYFLMIRPQMKRAKEHKTMLAAVKKGDEVVTSGGLAGRITKVGEAYVSVEVAKVAGAGKDGSVPVEMKFQKGAIQTLLPNGSLKEL